MILTWKVDHNNMYEQRLPNQNRIVLVEIIVAIVKEHAVEPLMLSVPDVDDEASVVAAILGHRQRNHLKDRFLFCLDNSCLRKCQPPLHTRPRLD